MQSSYVAINSNVVGIEVVSPLSEKFVVDGKQNIFEQYIQKDVRYPGSASLLEEINSNIDKIVSQNKVIQRELVNYLRSMTWKKYMRNVYKKLLKMKLKVLKDA